MSILSAFFILFIVSGAYIPVGYYLIVFLEKRISLFLEERIDIKSKQISCENYITWSDTSCHIPQLETSLKS